MKLDLFHIRLLIKYTSHSFFYFVSFVYSRFLSQKEIFLVAERGTDARDNGLYFFRYLKTNHPEKKAYYVISKDSVDLRNLSLYSDSIISFQSFKHYVLIWRAKYLISTHLHGFAPDSVLSRLITRYFDIYRSRVIVSLKHGITKDFLPVLKYDNTKLDLVIAGAKPEYDYMVEKYGYPRDNIQYTGFCRFDGLHDFKVKRQILLMPTWRSWLNKDNFLNSEYYDNYYSLLSNQDLTSFLRENKIKLVFYPHHEVQPFLNTFKEIESENIIIASKADYDVQELLKESLLLITDYSSVFFDFAYMLKPVIFYQFDMEQYRKMHYSEGYFDYNQSFGPVTNDVISLLYNLEKSKEAGWVMAYNYIKCAREYFPLHDKCNCARVFNCINKIKK